MLERNRVTNLTAVRDPAEAWERLIVGSLLLRDAYEFRQGERLVDVGAGGGIPGIPLLITNAELRLTLIESDQRKADFLRDALRALELGAAVDRRRAEEVGRDPEHRDAYDVALVRALAKAPVAAEYALPLVRPGGRLLALANIDDWRAAQPAIETLGGELLGDVGGVVVVSKRESTPDAYPRRVGIPAKRPLG